MPGVFTPELYYGPQALGIMTDGASYRTLQPLALVALKSLTLSNQAATSTVLWTATISNQTVGAVTTATSSDGTVLTVVGNQISGTFTISGSPNVTLTETLAGVSNTPNNTILPVTVA